MSKKATIVIAVITALFIAGVVSAQGNLTQPIPVIPGTGLTKSGYTLNVGAGLGVTVGADTVAIDPTYTQRRVSGNCSAGQSIQSIAEDGTVTCEVDDTGITNGAGVNAITKSDGTNLVASNLTDVSGAVTYSRDDSGAHANRPLLSITNTNTAGAMQHRAEVLFTTADAAGVDRTTSLLVEGGNLTITPYQTLAIAGAASATGNTTWGDAVADSHTVNGRVTSTDDVGVVFAATGSNLILSDSTAVAAGVGAGIRFDANSTAGALIKVMKTDGTSDVRADLVFGTRAASSSDVTERMRLTHTGRLVLTKAVGASFTLTSSQENIELTDTTAAAQGVGGQILLSGAYTGTTTTGAAVIKAAKTNNTAGNFSFDLVFGTRANGVGDITERLRVKDDGTLDLAGDLAKFGNTIDGGIYFTGGPTNSNSLNFEYGTAAIATGYINRVANAGSTSTFRNLVIADGKAVAVATFTGQTKQVDFAGAVTVAGNLDVTRVHYSGTVPVLSGCTANCTIASYSTDARGKVTCTAGANACTVTFASAYTTNAPSCTFGTTYTTHVYQTVAPTTSAFTFTTPTGAGSVDYHCDGML